MTELFITAPEQFPSLLVDAQQSGQQVAGQSANSRRFMVTYSGPAFSLSCGRILRSVVIILPEEVDPVGIQSSHTAPNSLHEGWDGSWDHEACFHPGSPCRRLGISIRPSNSTSVPYAFHPPSLQRMPQSFLASPALVVHHDAMWEDFTTSGNRSISGSQWRGMCRETRRSLCLDIRVELAQR